MKCKHCDGTGTTNWFVNGTFSDCPYCGGTGEIEVEQEQMTERVKIKCDDCKFVEDCVDYGWDGCKKFTPAPSKPQTNEEWFCTLSTEEKADFFANIYPKSAGEALIKIGNGDKERWVRWLKEKHNESV